MDRLIEIRHLTKRFGPTLAVNDVSFSVNRGDVLGFLGPNGAGKSTTMKMIVGFLAPNSGQALVCGHDVQENPIAVKRRIGYLPEGAPLYPDMTPFGYLGFIADIHGLAGADRTRGLTRAIQLLKLDDVLHQPVDTLSKGFKRRVALAQALLHDPEVLILDEPTDGLDPNQKHEVRALIQGMAAEKAIIISTHILEEVEAVCTRAVVIARGRVILDGTPEQLAAQSKYHNAVSIVLPSAATADVKLRLQRLPSVAAIEETTAPDDGLCLTALPRDGLPIAAAISAALQGHRDIREFRIERGRLDEVFRRLTASD